MMISVEPILNWRFEMKLYLDNASTSKIHPEVINSMNESYHVFYGNPSSVHNAGYEANKKIDSARTTLLSSVNAKNHHLIFTSGGTESNNLAVLGTTNRHQIQTSHFLCSEIEHPSVIRVYDHLKHEKADVSYIPVTKQGVIDIKALHDMVESNTHMVSVMHVNNETGIVQPVQEMINLVKKKSPKTLVHVDGVQAFGKIDVDLVNVNADFYSISAHKIGGPRGMGALIVKNGVHLSPIMWGGGQENNVRSGTENTPGIIGFEKATLLRTNNTAENLVKMWEVRKELKEHIMSRLEGITIIERDISENQFPGILTISIDNVKSEVILRMLSDDGIYISAGSACSSRKTSASHVLKAMKLNNAVMDGALRISFNETMTFDQITYFVQSLEKHVKQMRIMMKR